MVDEYHSAGAPSALDMGSDSSMVDEYCHLRLQQPLQKLVQIPLWSMNTLVAAGIALYKNVQIPLWSMNTQITDEAALAQIRSDSSMVDEYLDSPARYTCYNEFRFLYGR